MTRFYLAARYSRREELLGYAKELEAMGHTVTAQWITGCHELPGKPESVEARNSYTNEQRAHFAEEDLMDLSQSDMIISFTEPENTKANRGGRHVEHGYALAWGLGSVVIGHRENVFHCFPGTFFFSDFQAFREWLGSQKT